MNREAAREPPGQTEDLFAGGGEMGERMRALDWARTPIGPVETWPRSLATVVRILLTSRYAMWMGWGRELTFFCNDAYRPTLGIKHGWALGAPASAVWAEIWQDLSPRIDAVMRTGTATWDERLPLFLERSGYPEETYHTFSYSPIPDDHGAVGGLLCVVTEDTEQAIGERRLTLLRELGASLATIHREDEVFAVLGRAIGAESRDLPFTLTYLFDAEGAEARLACAIGVAAGGPVAPLVVPATGGSWPAGEVLRRRSTMMVPDLPRRFAELPVGPWDRPARQAAVVPIAQQGRDQPAGFLVAAVNPYRPFDGAYSGFVELLAGQIGSALANAHAHQEERRRAEALAAIDRAKTAFFSNVSHEFRTPLTLILGPVADALEAPEEALAGEALGAVHRNALRLLKLVNALLDFSRIEAGRAQASYQPTDLAALTAELASAFRSAVEQAGLRFEVDCPRLSEPIFVDHDMWEKIVLNLLSNALKFTFEGAIEVRLRERAGGVELSVSDSGTGIAAEELPRLFERFHRVQGARARTHEGSGIGLALTHELVRLHGGRLEVESQLDVGTTFTLTIPRGSAHLPADRLSADKTLESSATGAAPYVEEALRWLPARGAEAASPAIRDASRAPLPADPARRILLADDNADMREYMERLLGERYRVEAVADGAAALSSARRASPDLVVTDVMMPQLDGFGLLRALRADPATRGVPVIILSARSGEEARVEGLMAGADDYLAKPFSARELLARVATHLQLSRLRREAEAASRAKDEFLAMLGHELRNPLAPIVTALHLMRLRHGGVAERERAVIERQVGHLGRLVDDLLDVSRVARGKIELKKQRIELAEIVDRAVEMVSPLLEQRRHRLTIAVPPRGLAVDADVLRLGQVLGNLLTNAAKYTEKEGRITVRAERVGPRITLAVRDDGIGIDPEVLPTIFDLFMQERQALDRSQGGLGLGLSIARSLTVMHGGTVTAHSEGRGRGTEITLDLPAAEEEAAAERDDETPPSSGRRILVVDDNQDAAELLAESLRAFGHTAEVAHDGPAALRLAEQAAPDVALLDIGLPVMDGYELARRFREQEALTHVRLIAVTGYGQSEDRARSQAAGFDAHLVKPVQLDELRGLLEGLGGRAP